MREPASAGQGAVAVVDDDADLREALAFLLGTAGRRAVAYASAEALLAAGPPGSLACLLVDVRMPGGMDGIALLRELRRRGHPAPVLVMTGHGDIPLAVRAMREGASDFLEKPFDDAALLDAVEGALVVAAADPARSSQGEVKARLAALSPREREVLGGLVAGRANKAIAHDLGISVRTVEVHRANTMEKLGARSLSEAIRLALAGGMEAPDALRPRRAGREHEQDMAPSAEKDGFVGRR